MPKRKKAKKRVSGKKKAAPKGVSGKKKAAPKRARRRTPVGVGDVVRLPSDIHNEIKRYDPRMARAARAPEGIEGIVCSIRNIATGKLVPRTRGDLNGFVVEVLHTHTFHFQFSSDKNRAGLAGPVAATDSPLLHKIRALLAEMVARKKLVSGASGLLSEEPFASLLDGWRVVKMTAEAVESIE